MVVETDSKISGADSKLPWVKIISVAPHADLNTFGCSIEFKIFDENGMEATKKLSDFISDRVVRFDDLLFALLGFSSAIGTAEQKDNAFYLVDLLTFFLIDQAPTSLPGLSVGSLQFLFTRLSTFKAKPFTLKNLWSETVHHGTRMLITRKQTISFSYGLISSAHILTFPSNFKLKYDSMDGCAKAVNEHFYNYGPRGQEIFNLYRKFHETKVNFSLDEIGTDSFHDPVYFPYLKDDFFLNITCLNVWFIEKRFTIASLYKKYLDEWYKYKVDSDSKVPNFFAFELLAHWCICYSGHLNVCGRTGGWEGIDLFLKNMQVFKKQEFREIEPPPYSLKTFLEQIEIPYLFPHANQRSAIAKRVSGFITMGDSYRPPNAMGWDVIFHAKMNGELKRCFIECKLWTSPVGLPAIFKYYKKACLKKHPVSILVARSFQNSLKSPDVLEGKAELAEDESTNLAEEVLAPRKRSDINYKEFEELIDPNDEDYAPSEDEDDEVYEEEKKKAKITIDYVAEINKLWENGGNRINLYTVHFDSETRTFTWTELKVFPDPVGVFIVSDSNFNPPEISSRN